MFISVAMEILNKKILRIYQFSSLRGSAYKNRLSMFCALPQNYLHFFEKYYQYFALTQYVQLKPYITICVDQVILEVKYIDNYRELSGF